MRTLDDPGCLSAYSSRMGKAAVLSSVLGSLSHHSVSTCVPPYPLLCVVVVFGRGRSIWGLGAVRKMFFECGLLVQGGVADVFVDRVDGHLGNVFRRLAEETVTVHVNFFVVDSRDQRRHTCV